MDPDDPVPDREYPITNRLSSSAGHDLKEVDCKPVVGPDRIPDREELLSQIGPLNIGVALSPAMRGLFSEDATGWRDGKMPPRLRLATLTALSPGPRLAGMPNKGKEC